MLFDLLMGALDTVCDVLEYGPLGAIDIATSDCPGAERMCREITGQSISECLEPISTVSVADNARNQMDGDVTSNKKCETYIDEAEEEIISKAIAEKGSW